MKIAAPVVVLVAVLSALCIGAGCGARAPQKAALREVSVPDLSRLDQSVQTQIRGRFASLERVKSGQNVSDGQLGAAYGEYAMLLDAAEYYDAAEPAYLNAQALMPSDPRWPYHLAHIHRSRGETDQSIALLTRVLDLQPNNVAALIWLGRAYQDRGQGEQAQPLFERAQAQAPQTAAALIGLGQIALEKKDFARAVTLFEEALAAAPGVASVHSQLAAAYRGVGNTAQAEAHLKLWRNTEVSVPDPLREELDMALDSGLSYELRGVRAMGQNDFTGALAHFRRGVAITKGDTQLGRSLRHKLGTALFLSGDTDAAIRAFEDVVRLAPANGLDEPTAKANYSLGVVAASTGRSAEAIDRFTKAVASSPTYLEARLGLADAMRRAGRVEASLAQYEDAMRINPRSSEARFGYAMALVRLRRYAAARAWLEEALRNQPDQPELSHALARLYAAAPDAAVRDGRKALAITQELFKVARTTDLGETMAMTMAELGEFGEAVALQRDILAAAAKAGLSSEIRRIRGNLALYERRQPCRSPWPDDHPVNQPGAPLTTGTGAPL
jgi:tetratricopeptide (TPR) repeat protein